MHVSRRALLRASACLPIAVLTARCAGGISNAITVTEQVLNDLQTELNAFGNIKGLLPAGVVTTITGYISKAQGIISTLSAGSILPLTSAQNVFSDLEAADAAAAAILPGNPIVVAIGALLPAIALAFQLAVPASAGAGGLTVDDARARLKALPSATW